MQKRLTLLNKRPRLTRRPVPARYGQTPLFPIPVSFSEPNADAAYGSCPLWVSSRHVQRTSSCPLYPRKRHQMRHNGIPLLAKKRTSANKLRSCPTCFSWTCCKPSNLRKPGSPSLSHYMASMLGKCWWKIVTATTASAMGGGHRQSARLGRCHRCPPPRASEGGRSRQSPPGCCHHWALSSAYFVAFTGRFIHGNEVSPGNLCREPAAVAQLFFHLLDRFANHAQRLAGLELVLNFYQ